MRGNFYISKTLCESERDGSKTMSLAEQKACMRQQVLQKRDSMPKSLRDDLSLEICEKLISELANIDRGSSIAVYSPMKSEVDISRCIEAFYRKGLIVAFPCMNKRGCTSRMSMRSVGESDWKSGRCPFIEKPIRRFANNDPELENFPVLAPKELSAIIVPLVAFDDAFKRLGYGGGNYDEYLSFIPDLRRTKIIGVAYESQRVQNIITETHDLALPLIISA